MYLLYWIFAQCTSILLRLIIKSSPLPSPQYFCNNLWLSYKDEWPSINILNSLTCFIPLWFYYSLSHSYMIFMYHLVITVHVSYLLVSIIVLCLFQPETVWCTLSELRMCGDGRLLGRLNYDCTVHLEIATVYTISCNAL